MNEPVTARDVMNRSYVGVSEADSVAGAAELMRDEGVDGAVVLRGSDPVGIVSSIDIIDIVATGRDPVEIEVSEVMTDHLVSVTVDQRFEDAITALADSNLRHILVMDDGDIAGVLSEHDVVTAHSMMSIGPGEAGTAVPPEVQAELNPEGIATQGVCEICGSLSQDLVEVNGQVVCPACREI